MSAQEIGGIVRTILGVAAGYAVGRGYINSEIANALVGAATTIVIAVWSVRAKRVTK